MDAFSGYHQIKMAEEDEEKTAFITSAGTYCYKAMPFGLRNAGATYQRLMDKLFKDLIGGSMEVYVDDMIVKNKRKEDHVEDLRRTFEILRKHQLRLNPAKCSFGVSEGKFLGFIVNAKGIKANPAKTQAILSMPEPTS